MKNFLKDRLTQQQDLNAIYAPIIFRLGKPVDKTALEKLLAGNGHTCILDEIDGQLRELIKSLHPSVKIKSEDYPSLIEKHLNGTPVDEYGAWIYYPWSNKLVHTLDEEEFVEVRTNRNRYKITREEQAILRNKKIGVVGLSVGQSIALTLAMERTCGELRLADFDTAELSNLNRIRTGLHNLGLKKTVIAAREISEIDPYLKISIFDGLYVDNMDNFFTAGGKLDLLVEVCDGLDIKITSRFKARSYQVPVVMDTNDRGMLDVERFDLEPSRPILHGLAGDLDPEKITNLTNEEKIPYILKMIGADSISTRLKASMLEVEQSINTWPQLASSVTLGGAITTDVCRRIFLDQFHDSGRFYVDVDEMIKDKPKKQPKSASASFHGPAKLDVEDLEKIAERYTSTTPAFDTNKDKLQQIIEAACLAPSGGNAQPWKFLYKDNRLFIFHDEHYSYSLLDFNKLGSYIAFGAMLENIELKAASLNISVNQELFPLPDDKRLIAALTFESSKSNHKLIHLAPVIGERVTNRNVPKRRLLKEEDKFALNSVASSMPNSKLHLFEREETLREFSEILTNSERIRFLHPQGHYDTFVNELRFTQKEVDETGDGMDVQTLNLKRSDVAALQVARDPEAISFLHKLNKGTGFKKISDKNVLSASAIGVISMKGRDANSFLQGGRIIERIWLEANHRRIAVQPISQIVFMTELMLSKSKVDFSEYEKSELSDVYTRFRNILKMDDERFPVFVLRFFYSNEPVTRSLRRPLDEVFFINEYQR